MTNRTGAISDSRWRTPRTASRRRAWCDSVWVAVVDRGGRAERRHETGELRSRRCRGPSPAHRDRVSGPASGAPRRSDRTGRPRRRCRRSRPGGRASRGPPPSSVASRTRRDLPTPASPAINWWIGAPAAALSRARAMASSSVDPADEGRADEAAGHRPMIRARAIAGGRDVSPSRLSAGGSHRARRGPSWAAPFSRRPSGGSRRRLAISTSSLVI